MDINKSGNQASQKLSLVEKNKQSFGKKQKQTEKKDPLFFRKKISGTAHETTYGKSTTKSSEKNSAAQTKLGQGSLNISFTQCGDQEWTSESNLSVLKHINNSLGKENETVEDIHYFFVAFYQRSKRMLNKVEQKGNDSEAGESSIQNKTIIAIDEDV